MRFDTLAQWLSWQEGLHAKQIDLGLTRIREVAQRMGLDKPAHVVISVAGTNGKGSSVAMLEAILHSAGYRVGAYTSPHLLRYNERVRVDCAAVSDAALCAAFARIDAARGDTSLSYFEFGTLAAMDIFQGTGLDVALMEVGLGGRLDATNVLDADLALICSIGIDHVEWLGDDRNSIGREKAGIMRAARPVVCGDPDPPASIAAQAKQVGARLYQAGRDFIYSKEGQHWRWSDSASHVLEALPLPALSGAFQLDNAAAVLMALQGVSERLPVTPAQIEQGLREVRLMGRFERLPGDVETVLDVAHNPDSARALALTLEANPVPGKTRALFSALAGKDIHGIVRPLAGRIDEWYVAALDTPRSAPVADLTQAIEAVIPNVIVREFDSISHAYHALVQLGRTGDRMIVFGSFYTVAQTYPLTV